MGTVADKIERNQNLISSINQPLAVIGLNKIGQQVAGKVLTPVVWSLNYAVNGVTPDKVDVSLFGVGLLGGAAAPASIATGIVKAVVDDDINHRLKVAHNSEKIEMRSHIRPCYHFGVAPPQINAMKIASMGGTAWQHPNGLWLYITDARNHHIPNFKPKSAVQIYQPVWPLQSKGDGKFKFTINK